MKILIIGDSPRFYGGVTNYTRPLADNLSKNLEVSLLFNSTRTLDDNFFTKFGIKEVYKGKYNFRSYQLSNGKSVYKNYNQLDNDYSNWFDCEFTKFLDKINPDVVHVHELFGFTTSIFKLIKDRNIKLICTIHEYWWLCPKRVMVDFNNKICEGPKSFSKCSFCVSKVKNKHTVSNEKRLIKLKNTFPNLFEKALSIKNNNNQDVLFENLSFGNLSHKNYVNKQLENELESRFNAIISALNLCDTIIGVSSDVKNHLLKYGVDENKILVQHIGSTIAEQTIEHTKEVNENDVVFGFIGGVGYYKGVHQMVEAYTKLPDSLKLKSRLLIYGKYNDSYLNSIKRDIIKSSLDNERIVFHGKFTPNDIPEITNKIDINILPSLCADTAPQTIFESYSNGLPIIAPLVGGFSDFIQDGVNGLLYEKASVKGILKCLEKVINDPSLIEAFQENIPKCKTISENIKELIALYKS